MNRRYQERTSDKLYERGDMKGGEDEILVDSNELQSELIEDSGFNNPLSPNNQQ